MAKNYEGSTALADQDSTARVKKSYRRVMGASTLNGDNVVNKAGEDVGKIDEIMINTPTGRVAYAVLSFGGFLGMGDKLFAIPWSRLSLDENRKVFVLDVDRAIQIGRAHV